MSDREKLIELICESTNHDCGKHCNLSSASKCYSCTHVADYLLANGVVIPPCRIGDEVWAVQRTGRGWRAEKGTVNQMSFTEDMRIGISVYRVCKGLWGDRIFATKEEAEAEAKRRAEI